MVGNMDSQRLLEIKKDSHKAIEFAVAYTNKGEYAEALEMFEWFHFNALSIRSSLYGVRLSFALGYWMKLTKVYPMAKQRLLEIRDEEIEKIKGSKWSFEGFHDVAAISKQFEDSQTPLEIFKWIDKNETDQNKIAKCFNVIFESLCEKDELELCNKYLTDPESKAKKYVDLFKQAESGISQYFKKINEDAEKKELVQQSLTSMRKKYMHDMSLLVKILKSVNRHKDLESIYVIGKGIIPDEQYLEIFKK